MKTNALKGMKDILPAEQRMRDYVQGKILETYRAAGFERISTPILEDSENLDKSDGGDNLNLIFKVLKRGDKLESALSAEHPTEKELSEVGDAMRIMGLDFGSKTVGVAISDPLLITAQGIEIIRRKEENKLRQTLARIEELIVEYGVEEIVLGLPKNMNNTEGIRVELTKEFQEKLEQIL